MLDTRTESPEPETHAPDPDGPTAIDATVIAGKVLCFSVAVAGAAFATQWVIHHLPSLLPAHTDTVGYTIFYGFDSRQYYANYVLWVLGFPMVALGIYVLLQRLVGARVAAWGAASVVIDIPADPGPSRTRSTAGLVGGIAVTAFPPAVVVALYLRPKVHGAWLPFIATGLGYAAAVVVLGVAIAAIVRVPRRSALHAALAIGAALTAFAVPIASRLSHLTVAPTQVVRAVRWVPWPGGLVIAALPAVIVIVAIARSRPDSWARLARLALLSVPGPVIVVLLEAAIPGSLGRMDVFHEGEQLGGALLLQHGEFPWRDFLAIHGLFTDSLQGMLGFHLFGTSRWAYVAATSAVVVPVYFVTCYALNAYLLRRHLLMVAATVAILAAGPRFLDGVLIAPNVRMFLYPLLILAVAWLARTTTWLAATTVAVLLFSQVILTPESAFLVPAVAVAVVGYDLTHRKGRRWYRSLAVTLRVGVPCLILSIAFAVYLAANDALAQFIQYFRIFASGHDLSGAVPVQWSGAAFGFMMVATPVLLILAIWYVIVRVRTRRGLEDDDWAMVVVALFTLVYYQKFLARPDLHVLEPWASIIPLLWYIVARSLDSADRTWRRVTNRLTSWRAAPSTLVAGALLLFLLPDLVAQVKTAPARLQPTAVRDIQDERLGYSLPDPEFENVLADLRQLVPALDPGGEGVFDFTNQPGMFHFLLDEPSRTRYFHVSMAIPEIAQRDLVQELEDARPAVVVYYNDRYGLPSWDGIFNGVRHYDVSDYILDNYRPVVGYAGYVFLLRSDLPFSPGSLAALSLHSPLSFDDLSSAVTACDWGEAPDRLAKQPAKDAARSGALALTPVTSTMHVDGTVDAAHRAQAESVIALTQQGAVLAEVPVAAPESSATPSQSASFELDVGLAEDEHVSVVVRNRDGTLAPLSAATDLLDTVGGSDIAVGSSTVAVAPDPVGSVITAEVQPVPAGWTSARFSLPRSASDWTWLELRRPTGTVDGQYQLGVPVGTAPIRFQHLTSDPIEQVFLGSCIQWHDAASGSVVISTTASLDALEVELIG